MDDEEQRFGEDIDPSTGMRRPEIAGNNTVEQDFSGVAAIAPEALKGKITALLERPEGQANLSKSINFFEARTAIVRKMIEARTPLEYAKSQLRRGSRDFLESVEKRKEFLQQAHDELRQAEARVKPGSLLVSEKDGVERAKAALAEAQAALTKWEEVFIPGYKKDVVDLEQSLSQMQSDLQTATSEEQTWRAGIAEDERLTLDQALVLDVYSRNQEDIEQVKQRQTDFFVKLVVFNSKIDKASSERPQDLGIRNTFKGMLQPVERYANAAKNLGVVGKFVKGEIGAGGSVEQQEKITQSVKDVLFKFCVLTSGEREKLKNFDQSRYITDNLGGFDLLYNELVNNEGYKYMSATGDPESLRPLDQANAWLSQFKDIKAPMDALLGSAGIKVIPIALGKTGFDSRYHVGRSATKKSSLPNGVITAIIRNGFSQGDKILQLPEVLVNRI